MHVLNTFGTVVCLDMNVAKMDIAAGLHVVTNLVEKFYFGHKLWYFPSKFVDLHMKTVIRQKQIF